MSCVYMVGDLHLGHKAITKYRDVSSVEENNELMVDNILTMLKKRDTLWLLGDIFFSVDSVYKYAPELNKYIGNIHLILGNHDLERVTREERDTCLHFLTQTLDFQIYGITKMKGAWLSHAPIHPDELRGNICVHGHVHTATIPDNRYVNVSVDNTGFKPVKFQDIKAGWRGIK